MPIYAALIYAPIALIVFFSFNSGRYAMAWQGFSTQWYAIAFSNELIVRALRTSLGIALATALLATVIGTLAALGLERMKGVLRQIFDALIYVAIMVPSVVIGIATLIAFVTLFNALNPTLEWFVGRRAEMGSWTVTAAHVLFNIAVVILIVRARLTGMDKALVEAAADLYATPFGTFRQVILPLLAPAIVAGFLLSFTFSFEDFIIAFFVAGYHAADLCLLLDPPRRHAGDQCRGNGGAAHLADSHAHRPSPAALPPCRRAACYGVELGSRMRRPATPRRRQETGLR
jgi:spermidine/putrescine transport system permease protein